MLRLPLGAAPCPLQLPSFLQETLVHLIWKTFSSLSPLLPECLPHCSLSFLEPVSGTSTPQANPQPPVLAVSPPWQQVTTAIRVSGPLLWREERQHGQMVPSGVTGTARSRLTSFLGAANIGTERGARKEERTCGSVRHLSAFHRVSVLLKLGTAECCWKTGLHKQHIGSGDTKVVPAGAIKDCPAARTPTVFHCLVNSLQRHPVRCVRTRAVRVFFLLWCF